MWTNFQVGDNKSSSDYESKKYNLKPELFTTEEIKEEESKESKQ